MIAHHRFDEYKSALMLAKELAATHDCKYYVYDVPSVGYQATQTMDAGLKLMGEAYPGGRVIATGMLPGKSGGIRL